MLPLSGIQKIYRKIKKDISKAYEKKDFGKSILLINSYASIAQCINDVFRDDEIETYISKIAQNAVGIVDKSPHGIPPDGKRIVFYDQIGSTVCLGVQYIQGLLENGYQILYIYEAPSHPINQNLLKILQKEEKIEIILVDSTGNSIKKAKEVRDKIIAFNASKLIIHSPAYGAFGSIVLSCVPFMNRYRIVPGDHHFYIGYKCVDYFLEFRDFGVRLEVEKRALPIESIYKLPYYPLIKLVLPFQGFPEAAQGKITIVAAGAEYKFYGSNVYFDTCLHILTEHENVVILFIGYASPKISQFILANKLENRFIPLGYRKDFGECIKHADLLFNSYPFSGGLVGQ
ncbi:MAG: hypothetical protein LIO65_04315 [Odoribacter sp.]|nr:hypothetical protein [Odoribacter sp.]